MFTPPPPNMSCVRCHVSHVICHMSGVTCHMSHLFLFFFGQSGEAYWWRVCYQRGLPYLFSKYATKKQGSADCCSLVCLSGSHNIQVTFRFTTGSVLLYVFIMVFSASLFLFLPSFVLPSDLCKFLLSEMEAVTDVFCEEKRPVSLKFNKTILL